MHMLQMHTHLGKRAVSVTTNCFGSYSIVIHEGERERKKCHRVQGIETIIQITKYK